MVGGIVRYTTLLTLATSKNEFLVASPDTLFDIQTMLFGLFTLFFPCAVMRFCCIVFLLLYCMEVVVGEDDGRLKSRVVQ